MADMSLREKAAIANLYEEDLPYLQHTFNVCNGMDDELGKGLDGIILYNQIDTSEYRHLLEVLRESGGPNPVAIDLP